MKKVVLIVIFLFQMTGSFGQKSDWGPWTNISCYKGIQYSVKNNGYNKATNKYWWNVRWKNNYSKPVSFYGEVAIDGEKAIRGLWGAIAPGGTDTYTEVPYVSSSISFNVSVRDVCFAQRSGGCSRTLEGYPNFAICDNGRPNYSINGKKGNTSSPSNNSSSGDDVNSSNSNNGSTNVINDPTFDRNNASFQDYYKRATAAGQAGNYEEAISLWNSAISVAVNDAQRDNAQAWLAEAQKAKANSGASSNNNQQQEQQRQRQALLKQQQEQQRQQQLQQGINQLSSATADLITILSNRKRASKSMLSNEDAQVLLGIVQSENPSLYAQNIIDIFSDLGYTHKSTEKSSPESIFISMYDNSTIQWPLFIHINSPTEYNLHSSISFDYQRKDKLKSQLSALGDNLRAWAIEGISPTRQKIKIEKDNKVLDEKAKRIMQLIADFDKNNYWNSSNSAVFYIAKEIGNAYNDEKMLNDKDKALLYFRKAASIPLETLVSASFYSIDMESKKKKHQKELAEVYFEMGFLTDKKDGNEAIEWYKKAASVYKTIPINNIALIYKNGISGVNKDWGLAKEYYEKSAEEGSAKAMYMLGVLYGDGGINLKKDETKSKKWYNKACKTDKKYCN